MDARDLLATLLEQPNVDHEEVQQVFDQLPERASVLDFRELLIKQGVMSYAKIMTIFIEQTMVPRSRRLIERLQTERAQKTHFAPTRHTVKFHIDKDDSLASQVNLANGDLSIDIPQPDLKSMHFNSSDEQQAVSLAIEMALMGDAHECEEILLEVIESFDKSIPAIYCLCWVYLSAGHAERAEYWANYLLKKSADSTPLLEMLTLAEQAQSKHLLAATHLQRLLQNKTVKAIWYLLLAYSLEKSNCPREAIENYTIYSTIAKDSPLKQLAKEHLEELKAS